MISATLHQKEEERLQELESYSILDTIEEEDFDNLTSIAASICGTKISLISLIDNKRQWFKSHHGLIATETPREFAFCAHALNDPNNIFEVMDAREDKRFFDHSGVDYISLGRVLFRTILHGDESGGGGSTLSQQLAKNLYPRKHFWFLRTPINKFREVLIAKNIEHAFNGDKEGLISFYFNTVPFGGNLTGVHMASKRFFNKKPMDLSGV